MKYTWEEKDIICGRYVCKHPSHQAREHFEPCGNATKWTYKIGFCPKLETDSEGQYCLIAMTDGMVIHYGTKQKMVDKLNRDEMIPMPHKWLVKVINELRDAYNGE